MPSNCYDGEAVVCWCLAGEAMAGYIRSPTLSMASQDRNVISQFGLKWYKYPSLVGYVS